MRTVELSADGVEPPSWMPDLERVASHVLSDLKVPSWDVSVLLCSGSRIAELNQSYRNIAEPTDVLTFSQVEGESVPGTVVQVAGDVVISPEVVAANAEAFGAGAGEEMTRVFIHALLHLAGYEHDGVDLAQADAQAHPMLALQERYVTSLCKEKEI